MKIEFFENEYGSSFDLKPETVEEVATLARMARNTRAEKPEISFYFSGSPTLSVWMKKVNKTKQVNSIRNHK